MAERELQGRRLSYRSATKDPSGMYNLSIQVRHSYPFLRFQKSFRDHKVRAVVDHSSVFRLPFPIPLDPLMSLIDHRRGVYNTLFLPAVASIYMRIARRSISLSFVFAQLCSSGRNPPILHQGGRAHPRESWSGELCFS